MDRHTVKKTITSIPPIVYFVILLIGILFALISFYKNCCIQSEILMSIGCGIIGSVFTAGLIDVANTKNRYKRERAWADELRAPYCSAFLKLRDSVLDVAMMREVKFDDDSLDFSQWLSRILDRSDSDDSDEDFQNSLTYIEFEIENIKTRSEELCLVLENHIDNVAIDKEYRASVRHCRSIAAYTLQLMKDGEYKRAFKCIDEQLVRKFLKSNNEFSDYFNKPYSEDRWAELEED